MHLITTYVNLKNPSLILINNFNQIKMIISPDLYLSTSIILETLSTLCLKNTLQNKIWYIPSYCGYALSFYLFPKSFTKYSLNTAYTLWCGFGIVFTLLFDTVFYNEIIKFKKLFGLIIIIIGISLIK